MENPGRVPKMPTYSDNRLLLDIVCVVKTSISARNCNVIHRFTRFVANSPMAVTDLCFKEVSFAGNMTLLT